VGERPASVAVAHRPDVLDVGAQLIIDDDITAGVGVHARGVQAEIVGIRPAAHRDEQVRSADRIRAVCDNDVETIVALRQSDRSRIDDHVDSFGFQDLPDGRRDVFVFTRRQPRSLFDDRHPCSEPAVHLGELQRDVAAADDYEMFWHSVEFEHPDIGHEVDVGQSGQVGHHRAPTHVEEDPVGLQHPPVDRDRVRVFEAGVPADEGGAGHLLQPGFDAVAVVEHDLVLARLDLCHVDGDGASTNPVVGGPSGHVGGMGAGHQSLGGNAAVVDAGPADELAFDHRDGVTGLGQAPRQRRTRLSRTDDDRIEFG